MSAEVEDFLFGGGGKAAKFETIGDLVKGTILDCKLTQRTSMEDNTPLTWPDGRPQMQLVVTLATDERVDNDDDGVRRVYARGGNYEAASGEGQSMKDAIANAVKKTGERSLTEGGTLTVAYTGEGKKTNRGYSAPKLFKAKYEAPVASVAGSDLFDDD
jgi:hypothetical protein